MSSSDRYANMTRRIAVLALVFALALFVFSLSTSRTTQAADATLVLNHVTVIDATGSAPQTNMTVIITGDRITAMAATIDERHMTNAEVVDATGKFLIPGLWDMHVHWDDKDYLPLFIANGVTGIRIMWGFPEHHEWRKEIEQGTLLGPRMYIASAIVDGPNPFWPDSVVASNAIEGRQAVKNAKAEGADFVKVYSRLPRDAYFAIADEAKKEHIPFVGHVTMSITANEASMAGQMSIEHLDGIMQACSSHQTELLEFAQETLANISGTNNPPKLRAERPDPDKLALDSFSPAKAQALFATFKQNHTWQCPTLTVLRWVRLRAPTNEVRLKYMPPDFIPFWAKLTGSNKMSAESLAFEQRFFNKQLEIVGMMQHAGVGVLAGTDTSNPYCFPGFGLHDELEFLVQAGLTPMEALQAATRNPARFMGREHELGTIEKGKLADLVLLGANPLDDISNTRRINAVVYRGKLYSRPALDEMLRKAETLAKSNPSTKN